MHDLRQILPDFPLAQRKQRAFVDNSNQVTKRKEKTDIESSPIIALEDK